MQLNLSCSFFLMLHHRTKKKEQEEIHCHLSSTELDYRSLQSIQEHCFKTVLMLSCIKDKGIEINYLIAGSFSKYLSFSK